MPACISPDGISICAQCVVLSSLVVVDRAQAPRMGVITSARIMSASNSLLVFVDIVTRIVVFPWLNQGINQL